MRTASKLETQKFSTKKEFFVKTQRAVKKNNAATAGTNPGKPDMQMNAETRAFAEVTNEEKYHLIAEAAYYHAERRSFVPGYEMEDWLNAESEIELMLSKIGTGNLSKNV